MSSSQYPDWTPAAVGWVSKQWAHAQSVLGAKINDYASALDLISPGAYTLSGAMARQNKGKGRLTSTGVGNSYAILGAGLATSIIDNPLTESWYISCKGCVALSPSATAFIYAICLNGVSGAGIEGIALNGSISQTKFTILTDNGGPLRVNFAASVGSEIQLAVDYDFACAFDAQAGKMTGYLNQGLQATQTNLTQISPAIANIISFQLNQTGVFEVDDMFFAFKR